MGAPHEARAAYESRVRVRRQAMHAENPVADAAQVGRARSVRVRASASTSAI